MTTLATQISIAQALTAVAPEGLPFRFTAYDGSATGPEDSPIHMHLATERGLSYVLTAPGDLGLVRAYVQGDLEITGPGVRAVHHRFGPTTRYKIRALVALRPRGEALVELQRSGRASVTVRFDFDPRGGERGRPETHRLTLRRSS